MVAVEETHGQNYINKKKTSISLIILAVMLVLPYVSAISLDETTIINTTGSNTSLTFSVPITVDEITITNDDILLTGITCSNLADIRYTTVLFNTPNTNFDSSVYCVYSAQQNTCSGLLTSWGSIIMIVGLILTMVLIVATIGIIMTSFGVLPNLELNEKLSLSSVLIAVTLISALAILIIFIIYIFESGLCPAIGG
jgi:hypothetical protein